MQQHSSRLKWPCDGAIPDFKTIIKPHVYTVPVQPARCTGSCDKDRLPSTLQLASLNPTMFVHCTHVEHVRYSVCAQQLCVLQAVSDVKWRRFNNYDALLACTALQARGTSNDKGEASNKQVCWAVMLLQTLCDHTVSLEVCVLGNVVTLTHLVCCTCCFDSTATYLSGSMQTCLRQGCCSHYCMACNQ